MRYRNTTALTTGPGPRVGRPTPRAAAQRRGAATVELALLLPLLIFLFLVGMDYARVFYASVVISNCARNGAIYLSDPNVANRTSFETLADAVAADAADLPEPLDVTQREGVDAAGYRWVEVTVKYPFRTVARYPGIPSQVNISRTTRMRALPE